MNDMATYRDGAKIDWASLFQGDPDLLDKVLAGVGRVGTRGTQSREVGSRRYISLNLEDFSEHPFRKAVKILLRGRSLNELGLELNLDAPTKDDIERAAEAFDRHPSYFIEYRINYVCAALAAFLEDHPETCSAWYIKARQSKGIKVK